MRTGIAVLFLFIVFACYSQKMVNVCGEYRYVAPDNVSPANAKRIAIERARLDAMAKEFGTNISQTNLSTTHIKNGETETDFFSMGGTEVKGDWLGDTEEPEINISYEQNALVVTAKVCGKAREIESADIELSIKVLCNGIESERFKNNDRLSLNFRTPIDGYLAVFLRDDNVDVVSCLLPYENENGKARKIKRNETNVLLSTKDPIYPYREETILVTSREQEFNTLVFVFSEQEFAMPNTESGEYLPELSVEKFQKWLRKNRINDETMQTIEKTIQIHK